MFARLRLFIHYFERERLCVFLSFYFLFLCVYLCVYGVQYTLELLAFRFNEQQTRLKSSV